MSRRRYWTERRLMTVGQENWELTNRRATPATHQVLILVDIIICGSLLAGRTGGGPAGRLSAAWLDSTRSLSLSRLIIFATWLQRPATMKTNSMCSSGYGLVDTQVGAGKSTSFAQLLSPYLSIGNSLCVRRGMLGSQLGGFGSRKLPGCSASVEQPGVVHFT